MSLFVNLGAKEGKGLGKISGNQKAILEVVRKKILSRKLSEAELKEIGRKTNLHWLQVRSYFVDCRKIESRIKRQMRAARRRAKRRASRQGNSNTILEMTKKIQENERDVNALFHRAAAYFSHCKGNMDSEYYKLGLEDLKRARKKIEENQEK